MGKSKRLAKERLDKFYELAKEHGYRSRAAFKLIQLNKKFDFLKDAKTVVDLCAAPGSWCQVVAKNIGADTTVVGVDLYPIKPIPGTITLQGDITTERCRQEIYRVLKQNKADLVLHDGAPNVGLAWTKDSYAQAELVLNACRIAAELLRPDGTFVTKVFRSNEYTKVLWVLKHLFSQVTATKPQASRKVSAEVFVVCQGYLNPKGIDPRLLDPKHVFTSVENPGAKETLIWNQKETRKRSGYDQNSVLLFKKCPVSEFLFCEDPTAVLGKYNQLHFENPEDAQYLNNALTDEDIKACCSDLRVLGKSSFLKLIKWRARIRAQVDSEKNVSCEENENSSLPLTREQEEANLLSLVDGIAIRETKNVQKRTKKFKRASERLREKMLQSFVPGDEYVDEGRDGLFSIDGVRKCVVPTEILCNCDTNLVEENDTGMPSGSEGDETDGGGVMILDEERKFLDDEILNEKLESIYNQYLVHISAGKKDVLRSIIRNGREDMWQANEETMSNGEFEEVMPNGEFDGTSDECCASEDQECLLLRKKCSRDEIAKAWYENEVFKESEVEESEDEDRLELERRLGMHSARKKSKKTTVDSKTLFEVKPEDEGKSMDCVDLDGDESDEGYTIDEKAEIMALGKRLKNPLQKSELIDHSYSRYGHSDYEGIPRWFVDEEQYFNRPNLPITREEVVAMKSQLKAINARSTQRVAEAKARKKLRVSRCIGKMKEKLLKSVGSAEMLTRRDMNKLNEIPAKVRGKFKPRKVYQIASRRGVVSKSHGKPMGNVYVRRVDRRLKKDKRKLKK